MSGYFNCGAQIVATDERVKTKKQLKELMASDPAQVYFDGTAPLFQKVEGYRGSELNATTPILVVVGPDPYERRNWFANVTIKNGKAVVS